MSDDLLRSLLVCPWCLGQLEEPAPERLRCTQCKATYRIEDGIPRMLVEDAELICPFCDLPMEKQPPEARCPSCKRRFRMDVRVQGALRDHAAR